VVTAADGHHALGISPLLVEQVAKELRTATFNARAETIETKPIFRDGFKRTRCLIPISGYHEWQDTPGGKQPGISRREMARHSSRRQDCEANGRIGDRQGNRGAK
jgi:putative SOS response-associated peptidase YedK